MYDCETMPNDWFVECTSSNDGFSEVTFNTKTLKFRIHGFGGYLSDQNSSAWITYRLETAPGTLTPIPPPNVSRR